MKLLSARDVSNILKERGFFLAENTVRKYIREGIIPKEYVVEEIHGSRIYHRLKPETVEFLENYLKDKIAEVRTL